MPFQWNDKQPIYLQLKELVKNRILTGDLQAGDTLPSVRQVAAEYQVNPITVSKAWKALAEEKLVEKKRGLGMFVMPQARRLLEQREKALFVENEWPLTLQRIQDLGIDVEPLIESLKILGTKKPPETTK